MSDSTTPAPAHNLLSALVNALPSPGQGQARPRLHLRGQPQSLATHPTVRGGSQLQPRSIARLWLARCPHAQPTKALASTSAIPATEAVRVLHGHQKLGQTKPARGFAREMNLGGNAERRDLGRTRSLLGLGEARRAIAHWRIPVLISSLAAPFKLIR